MAADERENKSVSKAKPEEAPKAVKPEAEEHKEASPDEPEKKDEKKKEGEVERKSRSKRGGGSDHRCGDLAEQLYQV